VLPPVFPTRPKNPGLGFILLAGLCSPSGAVHCNGADFPSWAYVVSAPLPPGIKATVDDGLPTHVPDSLAAFTRHQISSHQAEVPDWHPADHPEMPQIVKSGREPKVWACGYCHLPTGAGRPENASLAGLTPGYIKQQIANFKLGRRSGSEPKRGPQNSMIAIASALTDDEVAQAAAYFTTIKPECYVKVVESETAPRSYVAGAMLARVPKGGDEPLGGRIIEMPDDIERADKRDSRTPYVAFVPVGSVKRGEVLVTTGASGKTFLCMTCHGPGLNGLVDFPRLAGRSPSYLMRQLYDFKSGTRVDSTGLMKVVVANLSQDDMVSISAYLSSLKP
jgi:cytochrome c553